MNLNDAMQIDVSVFLIFHVIDSRLVQSRVEHAVSLTDSRRGQSAVSFRA